MRVRILLFGVLKDRLGVERHIDLPAGATVNDVRVWAAQELNEARFVQSLAIAVNQTYADALQVLQEGDEIALLPPVSGGTAQACGLAVRHV